MAGLQSEKLGSAVTSDMKLESHVFLCPEGTEAGVLRMSQWLM